MGLWRSTAAAWLLLAALPTADAQPAAQAAPPAAQGIDAAEVRTFPRRFAPTFRGREPMFLESAGAAASRAWRDHALAGPLLHETLTVNNRVTVRTDQPQRLMAWAAGRAGVMVRVSPAAPGFYSVRTSSVAQAILLAEDLAAAPWVMEAYVDLTQPIALRAVPDDPYLPQQWHLINVQSPGVDARVLPVWQAGYSGDGVTIGIMEPGTWQFTHPDLTARFHQEATQPGGSVTPHASSVAGVAAASGGNGIFGCGAAFNAMLSSQRPGSDEETAEALAFRNDLNHIKNNSWGPPDDARIRALPSVVRAALEHAVDTGRDGLGTIFVWASGNGGGSGDRVDYDPYASSRFTIAVNAIGDLDRRAIYCERGSAVLTCAHSNGNVRAIQTTTWNNGWTANFGGTSSSAPLASGVIALMLEANPALTWRDVQHVLVNSARIVDPTDADWSINGAGRDVNYRYGFGAVDASAAVPLAVQWRNVPRELVVDTGLIPVNVELPDNDNAGHDAEVEVTENIRIESFEVVFNVETPFVGDLRIIVTSPAGTPSILTNSRFDQQQNLVNHVFTSVRSWDETSAGTWRVHVSDRRAGNIATWVDYRLVFYGTPACIGDLDHNGVVDLADVMALLASFGTCEGDPAYDPQADLNNSGCIGLADLSRLLEAFGSVCD